MPVWAPIIALGFGVIGTAYANSHAIAPGPHPSTAAAEAHDSKLDGALRRLTDNATVAAVVTGLFALVVEVVK